LTGIRRRDVLKVGAIVGIGGVLPDLARIVGGFAGVGGASPAVERFRTPLPIPPVANPVRSDATTDYYEITQRQATVEILPGYPTRIWGYDGQFPGPTFRARRGRQVVIDQTNALPEAISVHLHGGVTPPESDGFPTDLVPPGGVKRYVYPNDRRAATLWYHDHAMNLTDPHIYRGLAGLYLLSDEEEQRLPLPAGDHDVPLILQSRAFLADGSLNYDEWSPGHHIATNGDTMLVNGTPWPRFEVAARRYRFRILNASNSSDYELALSSGRPLTQIATEGGLLPAPISTGSILLGPAERVEVVVDFADYAVGTSLFLVDRLQSGPNASIVRFDVVRVERDDSAVPDQLADVGTLREDQAVRTRTFRFSLSPAFDVPPVVWTINGRTFDPGRSDADPRLGTVEIWRLENRGAVGLAHPVHIHLVNFQVLDRNGRPPYAFERGWKDTVRIDQGETVRVIARFEPYRGKFVFHCHNLPHEDMMMMSTFEVV
jgi:spore coat protein A, manganese oxidase